MPPNPLAMASSRRFHVVGLVPFDSEHGGGVLTYCTTCKNPVLRSWSCGMTSCSPPEAALDRRSDTFCTAPPPAAVPAVRSRPRRPWPCASSGDGSGCRYLQWAPCSLRVSACDAGDHLRTGRQTCSNSLERSIERQLQLVASVPSESNSKGTCFFRYLSDLCHVQYV